VRACERERDLETTKVDALPDLGFRAIEKKTELILYYSSSVLFSAKFEERDANVPKISELNSRVGNQYPVTDFISLEFMIMHFVHWSLVLPTAAHFAEYYTIFATSASDMCSAPPQFTTFQELRNAVQQYIRDFLDLSLQGK
jgi:hypothetical protein